MPGRLSSGVLLAEVAEDGRVNALRPPRLAILHIPVVGVRPEQPCTGNILGSPAVDRRHGGLALEHLVAVAFQHSLHLLDGRDAILAIDAQAVNLLALLHRGNDAGLLAPLPARHCVGILERYLDHSYISSPIFK